MPRCQPSRQWRVLTLVAVPQSFATLPSAEACGAAANDYLGSSAASAQLHTMLQEENGFTAQVGRICMPKSVSAAGAMLVPSSCPVQAELAMLAAPCSAVAVARKCVSVSCQI